MSGALDPNGFSLGYDPDPDGTVARRAEEDLAESFFTNAAGVFRTAGWRDAAENVDHYLRGRGALREFTDDQISRHPAFDVAEAANRTRFEALTLTGNTNAEVSTLLRNLPDGETVEFDDLWEKPIYRGVVSGLAPNATRRGSADPSPDDVNGGLETLATFGRTGTRSRGRFSASRTGDEIAIGGTVQHTLYGNGDDDSELFDFNPGTYGADRARVLETVGRANPFPMTYRRFQNVEARIGRTPDGNLMLRSATWGPTR